MAERPDTHQYGGIIFFASTLQFLLKALKFYEGLLQREVDSIKLDDDLSALLDGGAAPTSAAEELHKVERFRGWIEKELSRGDLPLYDFTFRHGSVRWLKSVATLYADHLKARRNAFAARGGADAILAQLDRSIGERVATFEKGVFGDASLVPLVVPSVSNDVVRVPEPASAVLSGLAPTVIVRPPSLVVDASLILDDELRKRCLDLLKQFTESGEHSRLDTVIGEACRILEARLRGACCASHTTVGVELATYAFGGTPPRLVVSTTPAEQEGAHLLFRGLFGFVRNPVGHRLLGNVQPQRALQIVGLVDYLLSLIEGAIVSSPPTVAAGPVD